MAGRVAQIGIVLDHREQRHDLFRRPAGAAEIGPFVECVGNTANGDLAVHHGGAAEALAPPVEALVLPGHSARVQVRPLPLFLKFTLVNDRDRIGCGDLPWGVVCAPVETGFEQQHAR